MKIYALTSLGKELASVPMAEPTLARRILYWMRRHNYRASDEDLANYIESDKTELQMALNKLANMKPPAIVKLGA